MECMHREGQMARGHAPFHIDRKNVHISIDQIPAWICTHCGEVYFEDTEVETMQEIMKAVDEQAKKLTQTT